MAAVQRALDRWVSQGNRLDLFVDLHCHTPLSDGLWLYPADASWLTPQVTESQLAFARNFMNRNYQFSVEPSKTPGCALWYAATRYSGRTGVLAFTSENPLLTIRTARGEKVFTTPEVYRAVGRDWVRAILEYFH